MLLSTLILCRCLILSSLLSTLTQCYNILPNLIVFLAHERLSLYLLMQYVHHMSHHLHLELRSEEERKSAAYDLLLGHHLVMLVSHQDFPEWHAGGWDITIMTL